MSIDLTKKRNMVQQKIIYARPLLGILQELFAHVNFSYAQSIQKNLIIWLNGFISFMDAAELGCLPLLRYPTLLLKHG